MASMGSVGDSGIYCQHCHYDLRLVESPECGREFDPADRRTFLSLPPRRWSRWVWRAAAGLGLLMLLLGGAWCWWGYHSEQMALAKLPGCMVTSKRTRGPAWLSHRLGPVAFALERVKRLDASNASVADLTPVAKLTGLQWLDLNGKPVSNLTPLAKLTRLTHLHLDGTRVSNLSPLQTLAGLHRLWLPNDTISDAQTAELAEKPPSCMIYRQ